MAEKALMQLRGIDRDRTATVSEAAAPPPHDGHSVDFAPEAPTRRPDDVETASYGLGVWVLPVLDGGDTFPGFDAESESDSDSRTTLPPPYSSNPSLAEQAV